MYLILIAIVLGLLLVIALQTKSSAAAVEQSKNFQTASEGNKTHAESIAFLSNGKLFHRSPGNDTQQISSPYLQDLLDKAERRLDLDHFHYDADNDRVLCSTGSGNGIRNLAVFDRANNDIVHYTEGDTIDAEKARRQAGVVRGVPSLVPDNWQLVSRNQFGQEIVVANHVLSFDISASGKIIYTNGFGAFEHSTDGPTLLFQDSLIEKILVY